MSFDIYSVASRDIVSESFDGEAVVLDLQSGRYFSFTDSGSCLWDAITAGMHPEQLVSANGTLDLANVETFITKLMEFGLIVRRQPPHEIVARPDLVERLRLSKDAPDVFVFDDLTDLFMADPIHDVEEPAGWPVVKAS